MSLGGFLLLFVASRLLYLALIDPSYLFIQPGDELYRGIIAQELVTGPTLPFTEYRADNYSGGSLVIGALAAGFFLLFGPTVFALKLAALLMFTLALGIWYWIVRRYAGERVAGYFAILFCFSPPLFTAYSVAAIGFHSESILFSALTVLLLFKMLSQEKPSLAYPVLLGLTAGFGLWFTYIYGLTLLAMLGFWVWHDKEMFWRPRVLWFALGFLVGFSPWIVLNVPTHFAGLVIREATLWEHFGLAYLWEGLAHPRKLAPYEFFADLASDDPRDLPRRAVNLLYSLLYLGPILAAGLLRLRTVPSDQDATRPARLTLEGFGILYLVVFALAVQFSNFKAQRYHLPAYPFLFFFVAHSLARYQDLFPRAQRQIQTVFIASVVVLGLGTHAPLLSLDRPGYALSTKGYSYAVMQWWYVDSHAQAGSGNRDLIPALVQASVLSSILPKLSSQDQWDLSQEITLMLADVAPLNGPEEDFSRIARVVPPGFDRYFYYLLGATAMNRHPYELPMAVAAVEFVRHRTPAMHHLALVGIYWQWSWVAPLDRTPESLANLPANVALELHPHYWRALGHYAGRYWYDTEHSLSLLKAHLQAFVPRLEPPAQRYLLQGVGRFLFSERAPGSMFTLPFDPTELEHFAQGYHQGLCEGVGLYLREFDLFDWHAWAGDGIPFRRMSTKGLSATCLSFIHEGEKQFSAIFAGPLPSASIRSHLTVTDSMVPGSIRSRP